MYSKFVRTVIPQLSEPHFSTLDYPNCQINGICGVHQIELTYLPIENILPEYSVIRMA